MCQVLSVRLLPLVSCWHSWDSNIAGFIPIYYYICEEARSALCGASFFCAFTEKVKIIFGVVGNYKNIYYLCAPVNMRE